MLNNPHNPQNNLLLFKRVLNAENRFNVFKSKNTLTSTEQAIKMMIGVVREKYSFIFN